MAVPQRAQPAELVQKLIIGANLAIMPGVTQAKYGPPQCYANTINNDIDRMVSVSDMVGNLFGRDMLNGKYDEHYGLKLTFRDLTARGAYRLGFAIQTFLDSINYTVVGLYGTDHHIENIYRQGTLIGPWEESPQRRFIYGLTYRLVLSSFQTTVAED